MNITENNDWWNDAKSMVGKTIKNVIIVSDSSIILEFTDESRTEICGWYGNSIAVQEIKK